MKEIELSQGKKARVDNDDYRWLSQWKWTLFPRGQRTPYAYRKEGRRTVLLHREILGVTRGQIVDHINRDGLDNRRCNLRVVTPRQNSWNSHKRHNGTSKYKGVHWCSTTKRWIARILCSNGKMQHIGAFRDEQAAAFAYNVRAKELRGEYAWLNGFTNE